MQKEIERLGTVLEGLKTLRKVPDAVFLVGSHEEKLAAKEAQRTGIPVVAIVDTNADPSEVAYVIPGNDDAVRSIQLLVHTIAEAVLEGRQQAVSGPPTVVSSAPSTQNPVLTTVSPGLSDASAPRVLGGAPPGAPP